MAIEVMPFLVVLDEIWSLLRVRYVFELTTTFQAWVVFPMRQLSVTFTFYNSVPVTIGIGSWQFQPQPVSVWIIGAFVSGGLLGLLLGLGLFRNVKSRVEIRRLTKALIEAEQKVSSLHSLSLLDTKK